MMIKLFNMALAPDRGNDPSNQENPKNTRENMSNEERQKMHDAYSEMGKKGGQIGGQKRAEQLGHEGYVEMGRKGGEARSEQLGHEGYVEMGKKGGAARAQQMAKEGTYTHKEKEDDDKNR